MYEKFLELLDEIVNEDGRRWQLKKEALLAAASDQDKINLVEFADWFAEESETANA